jgi:Ser/Thr protein kinase RdoA (MazF antagonist)
MTGPWAPVTRLSPERTVARLAALHGVRLEVTGVPAHGAVGAAYVRWPDGRPGVLTEGRVQSVPLLAAAAAAGVPVARYDLVADVDGRTVVVQSLLPGAPPRQVDAALVAALLRVHARLAGVLADRPDLPPVPLHLRSSGPGFCLHEPLAGYDAATARLLVWVRSVGAQADVADGPDLVHVDFHPGNVLVAGGEVTGVVDWDGAGRGDGLLDLVTLRFDLARRAPALGAQLQARLVAAAPAARLRPLWAHMGLRLVDWAIRHHTDAEVQLWRRCAEAAMRW